MTVPKDRIAIECLRDGSSFKFNDVIKEAILELDQRLQQLETAQQRADDHAALWGGDGTYGEVPTQPQPSTEKDK